MKRHVLTNTAVMRTKAGDRVVWTTGSSVWTTGETDPTFINGSIEVVPYPGSDFKV